jgi:hypothetical protein
MWLNNQKYSTLRFLLPFAREMTDYNPDKRPALEQAHRNLNMQFAGLAGWQKRWPIVPPNASFRQRYMYLLAGLTTEVMVLLRRALRILFFLGS